MSAVSGAVPRMLLVILARTSPVAAGTFGAGWRRSLDADVEAITEAPSRGCSGQEFSEDDEIVNANS
jgi:hypothetical protein